MKTMNKKVPFLKRSVFPYLLVALVFVILVGVYLIFTIGYSIVIKSKERKSAVIDSYIKNSQEVITESKGIAGWSRVEEEEFIKERKIEKEIPEDWETFENDFMSFRYPSEGYKVSFSGDNDKSIVLERENYERRPSEWTTEDFNYSEWRKDGLNPIIKIEVRSLDPAYEKKLFDDKIMKEWYGVYNAQLLKHGPYSINEKDIFVAYFDTTEQSKINDKTSLSVTTKFFPYKEYNMFYPGRKNVYLVDAYEYTNGSTDDFADTVEMIMSSLKETGEVEAPPRNDATVGRRPPRDEKDGEALGKLYLDLGRGAPTIGKSNSSKKMFIILDPTSLDTAELIPEVENLVDTSEVEIVYLLIFSQERNPNGYIDGQALICADRKGKFIDYKNKLHESSDKKVEKSVDGRIIQMKEIAEQVGLDGDDFGKCFYNQSILSYYKDYNYKLYTKVDIQYDPMIILVEDGVWIREYYDYVGTKGLIEILESNPELIWY